MSIQSRNVQRMLVITLRNRELLLTDLPFAYHVFSCKKWDWKINEKYQFEQQFNPFSAKPSYNGVRCCFYVNGQITVLEDAGTTLVMLSCWQLLQKTSSTAAKVDYFLFALVSNSSCNAHNMSIQNWIRHFLYILCVCVLE